MTITFVRHAEVQEEYIGKYNGHIDIPLSQKGKEQAKLVAKRLNSTAFDAVYCSDLLRTRETLEAFDLQQAVIFSDKLREKSWGKHEGKSFEEIEASGIKYENFTQWIQALDGEKIEDFIARVQNYFEETIFKSQAKNVLIITHSGVIKIFYHLFESMSLEDAFAQKLSYTDSVVLRYNTASQQRNNQYGKSKLLFRTRTYK
jgi:alpha-ribazole phosphatase/probable phosphoglycerate mutase